jgi:hypothetical protein
MQSSICQQIVNWIKNYIVNLRTPAEVPVPRGETLLLQEGMEQLALELAIGKNL